MEQPTLPRRRNIGPSDTVERKLGGSCLALLGFANVRPLPKIPTPMINGDGRDVTDFERDFGKPSNSNEATFAGDDLLTACERSPE
jgi:hypothetical protein